VILVAVSRDETSDSRSFARAYGIEFPLISDLDGAISKALVGIDDQDHSIPGVVVIRRDGAIVFRQIATSKDDRLTARALLEAIDRSLGTSGELATTRHPALERAQLRLETGAGQVRVGDRWQPTGVSRFGVLVPLQRYLFAGAALASEYREARLSLQGSIGVRVPILADIAAIQLAGEAGLPISAPGVYAGVRLGLWFAWTPRWAVNLDGTFGVHDAGAGDALPGWSASLGIARLLGR